MVGDLQDFSWQAEPGSSGSIEICRGLELPRGESLGLFTMMIDCEFLLSCSLDFPLTAVINFFLELGVGLRKRDF